MGCEDCGAGPGLPGDPDCPTCGDKWVWKDANVRLTHGAPIKGVREPAAPPPERTPINLGLAEHAIVLLLKALGQDHESEGLIETPRRVAKMWAEFLDYDPGKLGTTFESAQADQMVVVQGMRVWSMCEHHLLPFWCDVTVGYLAQDKVLGLSKLGRVAHKHAHRLQLQERLVAGIADELVDLLGHSDVAVLARGEHLCMTMRGIRTPHRMISSALMGAFRDGPVRAEFLALAQGA